MTEHCKHQHGDKVNALGSWVCGQCFELLLVRPKRFEMVGLPTPTSWVAGGMAARQEIVWQAEVRKSPEGTTLSQFLRATARRLRRQDKTLSDHEAHKLALGAVKDMGAEFGHPDYDWSRMSAIDIAEEEIAYWDDECPAGNG